MRVRIIGNDGLGRKYNRGINENYSGLHHYFKINSIAIIVTIAITTVCVIQNKRYQVIDIIDIQNIDMYSNLEIL